jgi:RimJ/RimL family protein N-acetyltransferase
MIITQTPRLLLREFNESDAQALFELNANLNVLRYTGDEPFKSVEEARMFVAQYDQYTLYGYGRWAVIEKSTGNLIGWCGLKYHPSKQYTDLGFRFVEQKWNQGFATEAAEVCLQLGFKEFKLPVIVCRVQQRNGSSIRVIEKLGFTRQRVLNFDGIPGWLYLLKPAAYNRLA